MAISSCGIEQGHGDSGGEGKEGDGEGEAPG